MYNLFGQNTVEPLPSDAHHWTLGQTESETDGIFDATRFTIYFFIILFGFFRLDAEICPETVWLKFRLVCWTKVEVSKLCKYSNLLPEAMQVIVELTVNKT